MRETERQTEAQRDKGTQRQRDRAAERRSAADGWRVGRAVSSVTGEAGFLPGLLPSL